MVSTGRCLGVSAFRRCGGAGAEYTVPGGTVYESLAFITRLKGVRQYRRANNLEAFASHQTSMAILISPFSVFTEWRNVSLPAVIRQLRLSRSSIRLPRRKAMTVRGTLADISDKVRGCWHP
ncbi:hypothetical protein KCP74_15605 [Salmonella enterica subsp. enterica]|nr:hypothetical protein KCP74_15605 [Salmonella enterica subsp. enterica]